VTKDDPASREALPSSTQRTRAAGWRWAAPLLSLSVLAILMGRVTTCGERGEPVAPPQVTVEPSETPAPRAEAPAAQTEAPTAPAEQPVVPLRGTKSFGIESPGEKAEHAPEHGLDTQLLGGSKSGFGGLGLRGSGRMPVPAQAPSPSPSPSTSQALP
jgi:hypothetical protein